MSRALRLFQTYRRKQDSSHALVEIEWRLQQLKWIVKRVTASQKTLERTARRQGATILMAVEMITLTETFYYLAWRLCGLLRAIPGFGKKFGTRTGPTCIGEVRNVLLEHPEKSGGPTDGGFMFGGRNNVGPVLKPDAQRKQFRDKGLYVNAQELADEIEIRLERLNSPLLGEG
jgi:hypothetical protein